MHKISALVIAPSRELVEQIHNQFIELIQVEIINNNNQNNIINTKKSKKNKKNKKSENESKNEQENEPENRQENDKVTNQSSEFKPLFKICKIVGGIYEDKD